MRQPGKIEQQGRKNYFLLFVQISAFLVLLGRAFQFYFFGAPFRAILWDESLLSPLVEGVFNTSWYDYATSNVVNGWIDHLTKVCAIILAMASLVSLFWKRIAYTPLKKAILYFAVFILVVLGICLVKDKNYDVLQFFELSLQLAAPILLLAIGDKESWNIPKVELGLKLAIAMTFIPHGLFAMGLIYVPGHFIDMTIQILGISENSARQFLFVAGLLDVLVSIALFIPGIARYALWYVIVWGILTALARVVAGFNSDFPLSSLYNHAYLTIYRLPHGLLPMGSLLFLYLKQKSNNFQNSLS